MQHALVRRNLGLIASLLQTLKNAYMRYNTVHHHGVSPTQLVEMQAPTADALDSSQFSDPAFLLRMHPPACSNILSINDDDDDDDKEEEEEDDEDKDEEEK